MPGCTGTNWSGCTHTTISGCSFGGTASLSWLVIREVPLQPCEKHRSPILCSTCTSGQIHCLLRAPCSFLPYVLGLQQTGPKSSRQISLLILCIPPKPAQHSPLQTSPAALRFQVQGPGSLPKVPEDLLPL